jgi:hypothetical protein
MAAVLETAYDLLGFLVSRFGKVSVTVTTKAGKSKAKSFTVKR